MSHVDMAVHNKNVSSNLSRNNFTVHTSTDQGGQQSGVRLSSRFARIIAEVTYAGERLPVNAPKPVANATYDLQAYIPLVKCELESSAAHEVLHLRASNVSLEHVLSTNQRGQGIVRPDFYYYTKPNRMTYPRSGEFGYIAALNGLEDEYTAELFVGFMRPNMTFMTCTVWNASVSYTAQVSQGIENQFRITRSENMFMNKVQDECKYRTSKSYSFGVCQTYSLFFKELSSYVTGLLVSTQE
jgi:hypothetical protein